MRDLPHCQAVVAMSDTCFAKGPKRTRSRPTVVMRMPKPHLSPEDVAIRKGMEIGTCFGGCRMDGRKGRQLKHFAACPEAHGTQAIPKSNSREHDNRQCFMLSRHIARRQQKVSVFLITYHYAFRQRQVASNV